MADDNPTPVPHKPRNNLTAEYVRSILDYDPETGIFTRIKAVKGHAAGSRVGHVNKANRGYVEICIDGTTYYAHRLAHLMMTGEWPPDLIDHQFFDRSDNRWDVLRGATPSQSQFNRRKQKNNKSGFKGVTKHPHSERWIAAINGRYIGCFKTPEEAARAYDNAANTLHGDYASHNGIST